MNQRIRELAIKHNLITESMEGSFYLDALEKFAKDIVRDCAGLCDNIETPYQYVYKMVSCADEIKQYFDVDQNRPF